MSRRLYPNVALNSISSIRELCYVACGMPVALRSPLPPPQQRFNFKDSRIGGGRGKGEGRVLKKNTWVSMDRSGSAKHFFTCIGTQVYSRYKPTLTLPSPSLEPFVRVKQMVVVQGGRGNRFSKPSVEDELSQTSLPVRFPIPVKITVNPFYVYHALRLQQYLMQH